MVTFGKSLAVSSARPVRAPAGPARQSTGVLAIGPPRAQFSESPGYRRVCILRALTRWPPEPDDLPKIPRHTTFCRRRTEGTTAALRRRPSEIPCDSGTPGWFETDPLGVQENVTRGGKNGIKCRLAWLTGPSLS